MKRIFCVAILLSIVALPLVAAADKPIAPDVQITLEKAIANEREAIARYKAFAAKADDEGFPGAASLFRAMAQAEQIHADRFAAVLKDHGVPVPQEGTYRPPVGSTASNLRTAATSETAERDGIYKDAIETCRRNNDTEVSLVFDQTRDVEVEHGNLCAAAARDLNSMKQQKTYYVCDRCGYTTDIGLGTCPDCMRKEHLQSVH